MAAPSLLQDSATPKGGVADESERDSGCEAGHAAHRAPGSSIGRNVVISVLGEGGMGVVYEAFDPELERRVAIKLMHARPARLGDGEQTAANEERARVIAEAQALAKVSHPNVIAIYDVGTIDEQVFLAMELIEGQTLRQWLDAQPRSWRAILDLVLQAGDGLAAVHARGLIHGDFKPDNILVDRNDRAFVVDFGLADTTAGEVRAVHDHDHPDAAQAPLSSLSPSLYDTATRSGNRRTQTQSSVSIRSGTPSYMAPEMHLGIERDQLSDQFAYCVSLYELLVGHRPFRGSSAASLLAKVKKAQLLDREGRFARLPGWLRAAIARGLAFDGHARHLSMRSLVDGIRARVEASARRRRWLGQVAWVLPALALLFSALAIAFDDGLTDCDEVGQLPAGVWDQRQKTALQRRLQNSGLAYASDTWAALEREFDLKSASWRGLRTQVCEASRAELDAARASQLDLQRHCLADVRDQMGALVMLLLEDQAPDFSRVIDAVYALPTVDRCRDPAALASRVPLPSPGPQTQAVAEFRRALARVWSQRNLGQLREASREAATLSRAAQSEFPEYLPIRTEIAWARARIEMDAMHVPLANELARKAISWAKASHQDELMVRAGALLVYGEVYQQQNTAAATEMVGEVDAALRRLGYPLFLEAEFARTRSLIQSPEHTTQESLEYATRAVELLMELHGREHPDVAVALMNLGISYMQSRQIEASVAASEAGLAIQERIFGTRHPSVALSLVNLGATYRRDQGRLLEGLALHRRAVGICEAVFGVATAGCVPSYNEAIHSYIAAGQFGAARRLANLYTQIQTRLGHPGHRSADWVESHLARIELASARPHAAIDVAQRGYSRAHRVDGAQARRTLQNAALLTLAQLRAGEPAELIEVALAPMPQRPRMLDLASEQARAEIALLLDRSDRARHRLDRIIDQVETSQGRTSPNLWPLLVTLAQVELADDLPTQAETRVARADDIIVAALGPEHHFRVRTLGMQAQIHTARGAHANAVRALQAALALYDRAELGDELRDQLQAELARARAGRIQ